MWCALPFTENTGKNAGKVKLSLHGFPDIPCSLGNSDNLATEAVSLLFIYLEALAFFGEHQNHLGTVYK